MFWVGGFDMHGDVHEDIHAWNKLGRLDPPFSSISTPKFRAPYADIVMSS